MMERLTMWFGNNNDRCAMPNIEVCQIGQRHVWQQMMTEKLAQYEDLEEQGLLVRLPCKVGDTVYVHGCGGVEEWKIQGVSLSYVSHGEILSIPLNILKSSLGKTVFLTREEAEAALEKTEQSK